MKSTILSVILCIAVLSMTVILIMHAPGEMPIEQPTSERSSEILQQEVDNIEPSRSYIIKTAHDAEDLLESIAFSNTENATESIKQLIKRLEISSDHLKDTYHDYHGSGYFSTVATVLREMVSTPFSDNDSFGKRVSNALVSLENAYPQGIEEPREDDPDEPMYYPKFDTSENGTTALAMLALYREQMENQNDGIIITVGGNITIGDTILGIEDPNSFKNTQSKSKYYYPLYRLAPVFNYDSITFANLETPLTEEIGNEQQSGSIKGLPQYGTLLKNAGVDLLSIANNGTLGFGQKGKEDTRKALTDSGIKYSDHAQVTFTDSRYGEKTVAFISYNIIDEIKPNVNLTFDDAPKADIATARSEGAKIVIVHFNWINTEQREWDPCLSQVYTARAAVDNGADLVIGTHPSVVSALEQYKGVTIVYSPGHITHRNNSNSTSMLYQQVFTIDENGIAVRGDIQVFPLVTNSSEGSVPSIILDEAGVSAFKNEIVNASSTVRYGLNKRNEFQLDDLNLISINKQSN